MTASFLISVFKLTHLLVCFFFSNKNKPLWKIKSKFSLLLPKCTSYNSMFTNSDELKQISSFADFVCELAGCCSVPVGGDKYLATITQHFQNDAKYPFCYHLTVYLPTSRSYFSLAQNLLLPVVGSVNDQTSTVFASTLALMGSASSVKLHTPKDTQILLRANFRFRRTMRRHDFFLGW